MTIDSYPVFGNDDLDENDIEYEGDTCGINCFYKLCNEENNEVNENEDEDDDDEEAELGEVDQ